MKRHVLAAALAVLLSVGAASAATSTRSVTGKGAVKTSTGYATFVVRMVGGKPEIEYNDVGGRVWILPGFAKATWGPNWVTLRGRYVHAKLVDNGTRDTITVWSTYHDYRVSGRIVRGGVTIR